MLRMNTDQTVKTPEERQKTRLLKQEYAAQKIALFGSAILAMPISVIGSGFAAHTYSGRYGAWGNEAEANIVVGSLAKPGEEAAIIVIQDSGSQPRLTLLKKIRSRFPAKQKFG